jgi:4'-phosphopantetheinyl transferase
VEEGSPHVTRGASQEIQVWQVDLRQPTAWVEAATSRLLQPDERERGARATPEVRRRLLVARAALRIALARCLTCSPSSLRFVLDPRGKPALAGVGAESGYSFSLARSGDWCLIATTTIGPIGVDVERVVALPELEGIVMRSFAPEEAAAILSLSGERRLRAFYNCWTRKEAYLKAKGIGLTSALDRVAVTVDDERPAFLSLEDDDPGAWTLATVHAGPGLVGAVALSGARDWSGGTVETRALSLDAGYQ